MYKKVTWVEGASEPTIEVRIEPRANSRLVCSGCGRPGPGYDRLPTRRFQFVPLWPVAVFFVYAMRRVDCPSCGVTVERVPWARGKSRLTTSFRWFLARWAKRLSWDEVASIFQTLDAEVRQSIRFVCSDMWQPYLNVVAEQLQQAVHVLDRFHIMKKMNGAIDEVRRGEAARLERDGYEPVLKHSRWCLLKRRENLTEKQTVKLAELLQYNLQSVRSHLLREDFQQFWQDTSPVWAGKFLDQWCTRTLQSRIEPMKKIVRSLREHRDLILNWFRARGTVSAGAVEGLNNKAKLTIRKAYGFRTYEAIEIALYHTLGKLPEPEFTHTFC